ncbi:MAG: transposase [Deltaproteobacteria bacterium]|nr:transposase [Deltaproteobacteria bacterium]MCK5681449.1 transposase [bacterium]
MPRKPRFYQPGVPAHVFQRGHNKLPVFFEDFDYLEYLRCLKKSADKYGCDIHAYVLMTNHVHLLLTPQREDSISQMFQSIGREYVRYINQKYQRCGGLWEGRHKGNIIESCRYLLLAMRYIERNPVRAGIVKHPAEYRWSSYIANALGKSSAILQPQEEYLALEQTSQGRCTSYKALFKEITNIDEQELIRQSLSSGTPLGSDHFKKAVEEVSGNKIGYSVRGRPAKERPHL